MRKAHRELWSIPLVLSGFESEVEKVVHRSRSRMESLTVFRSPLHSSFYSSGMECMLIFLPLLLYLKDSRDFAILKKTHNV